MSSTNKDILSPADQEQFAAMVERMRQLRRQSGVPHGMTAAEAVALHMLSAKEVEQARWGDSGQPAPLSTQEESHELS
jgi:hypothetical protein